MAYYEKFFFQSFNHLNELWADLLAFYVLNDKDIFNKLNEIKSISLRSFFNKDNALGKWQLSNELRSSHTVTSPIRHFIGTAFISDQTLSPSDILTIVYKAIIKEIELYQSNKVRMISYKADSLDELKKVNKRFIEFLRKSKVEHLY